MDPDSGSSILIQLLLLILLTLINAFFSASELALISIDRNKLRDRAENKDKKAQQILALTSEQSRFLSTIQVGITFAGFFSSALAAANLSHFLVNPFKSLGIPYSETVAIVVVTLLLSYFTLVFGELVPKRVALTNSEKFAYFSVSIVSLFAKLTKPFVALLSVSTNFVLKLLGVDLNGVEEMVTLEDLKSIVSVGQEQGVINPIEKDMIDSVIVFDDKLAEEIMTARTEVFMIDIDDEPSEYVDDLLNLQYSRIPVYEDSVDNIIGILYVKDLFKASVGRKLTDVDIRAILRPAYFVPERKNINDLFLDLKASRNHIAILIDEYGGFSGIVTMEDLIEEIVGDIDDEYDYDEPDFIELTDRSYLVKASMSIMDLNSKLGLELDEETEDYDSVGGLIIYKLGYIPDNDDRSSVNVDGITFTIEEVEENKIQKARIDLPLVNDEVEEV